MIRKQHVCGAEQSWSQTAARLCCHRAEVTGLSGDTTVDGDSTDPAYLARPFLEKQLASAKPPQRLLKTSQNICRLLYKRLGYEAIVIIIANQGNDCFARYISNISPPLSLCRRLHSGNQA